ncbi:hypothetical protein RYX36_027572, partial [Vicia faba]
SHSVTGSEQNGALILSGAPFHGTWARFTAKDVSPYYNSNAEGDRFSCLDIRCRESFYFMCQNITRTKTISGAMQANQTGTRNQHRLHSMVHGVLQLTPSIQFRYVLHRCKSLDIYFREPFYIMCQNTTRTKTVSGAMQ